MEESRSDALTRENLVAAIQEAFGERHQSCACAALSEDQRAALAPMIAEYEERVAGARARRQFWQKVQLRGTLWGLVTLAGTVILASFVGWERAIQIVLGHLTK